MAIAKGVWRHAGEDPNLFTGIDDMLQRIRRERSAGPDLANFKTGTGGIIEAEFLVQGLQMRTDTWQPNWAEAVEMLTSRHGLKPKEAKELKTAYTLLRRCESILRRYENTALSTLPMDEVELLRFARRLGFKSIGEFNRQHEAARSAIHQIYLRRFGQEPTTNGGKNSPALAERAD